MYRLLISLALLFIVSTPAFAGFSYYRSIIIDHTKVNGGSGSLTQFPVLVCGNGSNACNASIAGMNQSGGGAHVTNANGYDINFFKNSNCTSALTWEMENYNASTGEFEAWVTDTGTALSGTVNTTWYMCYGNPAITTFQSTATAVWDAGYVSVYHLGANGSLSVNDSSSLAANLTNVNSATLGATQIDGGVALASASTQYLLNNSNAPTFSSQSSISYEAWANGTSFPASYNSVISIDGNSGAGGVGFVDLLVTSAGKIAIYLQATGIVDYDGTGSTTLSTGTKYFLSMSYGPTNGLIGYVNGAVDGTAGANGGLSVILTDETVGNESPSFLTRLWNGSLDEVRASDVERSAGWFSTDYNNQNAPASFYTMGSETSNVSLTTSTIGGVSRIGGVSTIQ